jgi:hypothetical protein
VTGPIARLLRLMPPVARGHRGGRCGCPLCHRAERAARTAIGMPPRHPERITRELPGRDEEWLAALTEELWPEDEYAEIITEIRRQEGQP